MSGQAFGMRLRNALETAGGVACDPKLRRIERATRLFTAILVGGMALAIVYHSILTAFGIPYPWGTFLFAPADRFNDWFNSLKIAATHDPYFAKGGGAYFPFAYLAMRVGDVPSATSSLAIFKTVGALLISTGFLLFWRNYFADRTTNPSRTQLLWPFLLIGLLNYPLWFALDRGNIDLWICGLCLIYVAGLQRRWSWMGPLALGAAIALKGYPLAFVLLGLRRRRYTESALVVLVAVGLTLLALASFHSGIHPSWYAFQKGQHQFWLEDVIGIGSLNGSTDPYNGIQGVLWILVHAYRQFFAVAANAPVPTAPHPPMEMAHVPSATQGALMPQIIRQRIVFANVYVAMTTLLSTISALFVLFVPTSSWRRVTVISVTAILYPHIASDYKLLMLMPAVLVLLSEPEDDRQQNRAFWLLALLMVPETYFYIYERSNAMLMHPVLIALLWWTAIWDKQGWVALGQTMRTMTGRRA